jgi:hypothetical protein
VAGVKLQNPVLWLLGKDDYRIRGAATTFQEPWPQVNPLCGVKKRKPTGYFLHMYLSHSLIVHIFWNFP